MYRALDEDDVEDEDETTLEAEPLRESVEGGEFKSDSGKTVNLRRELVM